jgi:hypothetical protein
MTNKQELFVEHYLETGDAVEAAKIAGFSSSSKAFESKGLGPRIIAGVKHVLETKGAPVAIRTLLSVANGTHLPAGARVDAAKTLLDRAGITARQGASSGGVVDLGAMTDAELRMFVQHSRAEQEIRQKAQSSATIEPQVDDLI